MGKSYSDLIGSHEYERCSLYCLSDLQSAKPTHTTQQEMIVPIAPGLHQTLIVQNILTFVNMDEEIIFLILVKKIGHFIFLQGYYFLYLSAYSFCTFFFLF